MDTITLPAMLQLVTVTAALALFAVGLYATIKDLSYNGDPSEREAYSKAAFRKAMIMIACGIGVFAVSRFVNLCGHPDRPGVGTMLLQSLWESVRDRGFLLLIPLAVRLWRRKSGD